MYLHQSETEQRPRRTFVVGHDNRDDAAADMFRLAAVLRRAGLRRYGVSMHRIVGSRGDDGWGVYVADREPDQAPPAGLSFGASAA